MAWYRNNECSRRLAQIPGVGPIGAVLLVMKAPAPEQFASGRQFAAWMGLTPRDHSTAGKVRLGIITRAGDEALRSTLVVGATSLEGDIAAKFLSAILAQAKVKALLSTDHFSVDGTLIEAWASMKSVRPKDGSGEPPAAGGGRNAEADFHCDRRSNKTHASATDPEVRLYKKGKGKEAKLCFMGHGLMENRHGLLVDACLTQADGHAERKRSSLGD